MDSQHAGLFILFLSCIYLGLKALFLLLYLGATEVLAEKKEKKRERRKLGVLGVIDNFDLKEFSGLRA
jgi:hypothetical protein